MGEIVINEEIANRLNEDTTEEIAKAANEGNMEKVQEILIEDMKSDTVIPAITMNNPNPVLGNKTSIVGPALEKAKKNRVQKATTSVSKAVENVDSIVGRLEDQIKALRFLNSVQTADVPTPLQKEVRETLLQYQKDLQALKSKYVEKIQKL